MEARQILDSLTAHISLFHRSSTPNATANSGHRSSIIRWFSSLTVDQRQSHLTAVDCTFVQLLLRMKLKLLSNGHCLFLILPDIPSSDTCNLPTLCSRSFHGLLARAAKGNLSEMTIRDSIRLFGSKEEDYGVNQCFSAVIYLDSMTICHDFLSNVDRFVAAMDDVSNGGFLRGNGGLGEGWVEMPWLKAMGYYSMEAFVANRLELSLRLAWMNRSSNKKGVKLKDKLKEKAAASTAGANVFCRKKGFCDWWTKLDRTVRVKIFQVVCGKAVKSLIDEVIQMACNPVKDRSLNFTVQTERQHRYNYYIPCGRAMKILSDDTEFGSATSTSVSGDHGSFRTTFDRFIVLQDIVSILSSYQYNDFEEENLFFSTLSSVYTISDYLLRKFRGLLMIVSLECTKFELLGDLETQQQKSTQISVSSKQRKKGRNRNTKKVASNSDTTHHLIKENPPAVATARSSRKGRQKNSSCKFNFGIKVSEGDATFNANSHSYSNKGRGTEKITLSCDDSPALGLITNLTDISSEPNPCYSSHFIETASMNDTENNSYVHFAGSEKKSFQDVATRNQLKNDRYDDDKTISSKSTTKSHNNSCEIELSDSLIGGRTAPFSKNTDSDSNPCLKSVPESGLVLKGKENSQDGKINGSVESVLNCPPVKITERGKTNSRPQGNESEEVTDTEDHRRLVDCILCDCSRIDQVPHLHHQYMNLHHPFTITERLHLDVGRNWHNHFQRAFFPPIISPFHSGGACARSQQMSVSLDWPPVVRNIHRVVQPVTYGYESGDITWRKGFTGHAIHLPASVTEGDENHSADIGGSSGPSHTKNLTGEPESLWFSENEMEMHSAPGMDYSQYFGGGVMYWNSSDHVGIGFSRPPSLSSDDNSWAWHDADMGRSVDDIVAFSSSYSTTGLTSPTSAPLCSPFDTSGIGNQGHCYVPPMNEVSDRLPFSSKVHDRFIEECTPGSLTYLSDKAEEKTPDLLPYPVLRPIIIPSISAKRSVFEFRHNRGPKSQCAPSLWKDRARMKRPTSPVVLSVSHAPCPPSSISSASDCRRQKGVPFVRSGSSSPRQWGPRGCYEDVVEFDGPYTCLDGSEVLWPSWRKRNLSTHPMVQPPPGGSLVHDHMIALSHLQCDQDHPDAAFPLQPPELTKCLTRMAIVNSMQNLLHDDIELFCNRVASDNAIRKPYINWAVQRVAKSLQDIWPRSKTNIYGSSATGLSLPTSDVDLVVCLPPVRNLEPIKEAGILEGRNGIKETCLQHAARYLANQDWVKNDSLKIIENTAVPIIVLVVEVPSNMIISGEQTLEYLRSELSGDVQSGMPGGQHHLSKKSPEANPSLNQIRIDISFKSQSHTGLQTTKLVRDLIEKFPAAIPLSLVLKQFLADRSLDQSYSGGLSSYCLIFFVIRYLQHRGHHGLFLNQNHGSLLMDFLYFFGNIFDPRRMRISIKGTGLYMTREKGYSIDPLHIDDPLFPTNNVGRNCFRMHQCIKAFSDAFTVLENEIACFSPEADYEKKASFGLLHKIVPSIYNL